MTVMVVSFRCANISQIRDDQTVTIKILFRRDRGVQARSATASHEKGLVGFKKLNSFVDALHRVRNAGPTIAAIETVMTRAKC